MHDGKTWLAPGLAVWLLVFLSPSAGLFLALLGDWHGVTPPSNRTVEWLFGLVPLAALLVCCAAAWVSARSGARRAAWMVFTLLAMGCQCGLILVILAMATDL